MFSLTYYFASECRQQRRKTVARSLALYRLTFLFMSCNADCLLGHCDLESSPKNEEHNNFYYYYYYYYYYSTIWMLRIINPVLSGSIQVYFHIFSRRPLLLLPVIYNTMWNLKWKPIPLHSLILVFSSFLNDHVSLVFHNILSLKYFPCRTTYMR